MSKSAERKQQTAPPEQVNKIARISPALHKAITAAGKPYGFSFQKSFDLLMGQLFPSTLTDIAAKKHLAEAVTALAEVNKPK